MTRVSVLPAVLRVVIVVGAASASACDACGKDPVPGIAAVDGGGGAVSSSDDDGDAAGDAVDASSRLARMTEERAEEARRDASAGADAAVPAECEGKALRLIESVLDPRCAVTTAEWRFLSDGVDGGVAGGAGGVKQEAHVVEGQEGSRSGQVVLSLVNRGATAAIVPLRFNPEHPELAVSVIAEDAKHALFELAAPSFEMPAGVADAGVGVGKRPVRHSTLVAINPKIESDAGIERAAGLHVRSARIRLPANGGTASVRVTIDPTVTRRVDRSCPPAGGGAAAGDASGGSDCAPPRLPSKAKYTLHIGQLITGIDVGLPARVEWVVP